MKHQDIFKDDPRYTGDKGYFCLTGYLELIGIELDLGTKFPKKSISLIINGERNMGKSYGAWSFIENSLWIPSNYQKKVAYCRTNKEKMRKARQSFNGYWFYTMKKYWMSDAMIYKVEFDEKGKEIWEKRVEIGACITVNNEENFKSGIFKDYHMIFYDEYNEDNENPDLWFNWINLIKTVKRQTEPFFILLMGNKINPNSDFLVNLEIEIEEKDAGEDIHIAIPDKNIHFIDISRQTYKHLNTMEDIVNQWASANERTDAYINKGEYLIEPPSDVRVYTKRIEPTKQLKFYLGLDENIFEFGTFYDEKTNKEANYIHMLMNKNDVDLYNYKTIILDKMADIRFEHGLKMLGDDDYIDLANYLRYQMKHNKLYYSTFAAKTLMEKYIIRMINLVED